MPKLGEMQFGLDYSPPPGQEDVYEKTFQNWYAKHAKELGINPDPDDPQHHYDYRAAFLAGAKPDANGHWPSQFKTAGHPNRFVDGRDTITGEPLVTPSPIDPSKPQEQPGPVVQDPTQVRPGQSQTMRLSRMMNQRMGGHDRFVEASVALEAEERAEELTHTNPLEPFDQSPAGFVQALVVNHGRTTGEALNIIREQYESGNKYVRGLPGIDKFVDHIPGTLSLSFTKFGEGLTEPLYRAGEIADIGRNKLSELLGGPKFPTGITGDELDTYNRIQEEGRPPDILFNIPIPYTGMQIPVSPSGIVGALPGMAAAGFLQEAAAVPLITKAAGMFKILTSPAAKAAVGAVRTGGPLLRTAVESAAEKNLARLIGRGGGIAAGVASYDLMYGHQPTIANTVGNVVGMWGLGKVFGKIAGRKALDKGFEFLSGATGTPIAELRARTKTLEQMLHQLEVAGAPDSFKTRILDAGAATYGKTFGTWTGRWFAKNGVKPEDVDIRLEGIAHKEYVEAARKGYYSTSRLLGQINEKASGIESITSRLRSMGASGDYLSFISSGDRHQFAEGAARYFGRRVAQTGEHRSLVFDLTEGMRPKYRQIAIDEYNSFIDEMGFDPASKIGGGEVSPLERLRVMRRMEFPHAPSDTVDQLVVDVPIFAGGATKYYPMMSPWNFATTKQGAGVRGNIVIKRFENPLEVHIDPTRATGYAAIQRLQEVPYDVDRKVVAAELQHLQYLVQSNPNISNSVANNIIDDVAHRLAKRYGFKSIIYHGKTPDRNVYVDLTQTSPQDATATQIIERAMQDMREIGRAATGKSYLSYLPPIVVGLTGAGIAADEAKGMPLKVPPGVTNAASKTLPRTFKTLISGLGRQIFGHEIGETAHPSMLRHFEEYAHLPDKFHVGKSAKDDVRMALDEAIEKHGYVRGGRDMFGPFVEFNWEHEGARGRALNFVKEVYQEGDIVNLDAWVPKGRISFQGPLSDAEQVIKTGEIPQRPTRIREFLGIAAGLGAAGLAIPDEAEAVQMRLPFMRDLAKAAAKPLTEFLDDIRYDFSPNRFKTTERFALEHINQMKPGLSAAEGVEELQRIHGILKASDKPPLLTPDSSTRISSGEEYISGKITHPEVDIPVASYSGKTNAAGDELTSIHIHGLGPGVLGPRGIRSILGQFKTAYPLVKEIHSDMRLTGTAEQARRGMRESSAKLREWMSIAGPVGIGLGALAEPDEAEGMSLKPLVSAVVKSKTIQELTELLEPKLAAVVKQAAMLSGKTKPLEIAQYLTDVQKDVNTFSGKATAEIFEKSSDYLGVNVTHEGMGPFPLVVINGGINAHTGTWYPQVKSGPLGFSKAALKKVFKEIQIKNPGLINAVQSPKGLAGILALTALAPEIYDLMSPSKAEGMEFPTKQIIKWLGKGMRGPGDAALEKIARSKNIQDLLRGVRENAEAVRTKVAARIKPEMDLGEMQFIKFDTLGHLEPETMEGLGIADSGEGMNWLFQARGPAFASDHPFWQSLYGYFVKKKDDMFTGEGSTLHRLHKRAAEIMENAKILKPEQDDFYRAVHGLRTTKVGGVVQTEPNIPARLNEIAKTVHKEFVDPIWQLQTGVDPRAVAVFKEASLEPNQANFKIVKGIQTKKLGEANPYGTDAKHIYAAGETYGWIEPKAWQWRNLDTPYEKAKFLLRPMDQERAHLKELISYWNEMYGANPPTDIKVRMKVLDDYLKQIEIRDKNARNRPLPKMEQIHDPQFQPFDDVGIPFEAQEKDVGKLLYRHIYNGLNKAFYDEQNTYARVLIDHFTKPLPDGTRPESAALADYIREFFNTANGIKSLRGDRRIAGAINSMLRPYTEKRVTEETIRKIAHGMLEYTYVTRLGFGLRYPIVNMTQPLQTTAMVTGVGPLVRAYFKVMNDEGIWEEARQMGIIRPGISRAMSEIGGMQPKKGISKWADMLPVKSENLNRVVTYQAGKDWALNQIAKTGSVDMPRFIRPWNKAVLGSGDVDRIAKEAGAAITRSTQFMFGPEGRPLFMSGGVARQLMFQFKSFTSAYGELLGGALRHGRETKDWGPFARGMVALLMFGGLGAIPLAGSLYGAVKMWSVKKGIKWFPDENESGLGYFMNVSASMFGQPSQGEDLKQALSLLQLSGSYTVLDLPGMRGQSMMEEAAHFAAGPTFGAMAQIGGAATDYMKGKKPGDEAFQQALRGVSPGLVGASGLEALQMAGNRNVNKWLSDFGYRGGIYSPTGRLLARQQGSLGVISRAFNLQKSMRQQRYDYLRKIQAAYEGGQNALAQNYRREAEKRGFIISNEDIGHAKGAAKSIKSKKTKPNEPLR